MLRPIAFLLSIFRQLSTRIADFLEKTSDRLPLQKKGQYCALCGMGFVVCLTLITALFFPLSCEQASTSFSHSEREAMDSIVGKHKETKDLEKLVKQFEDSDNMLGRITALRALGTAFRSESRFEEALNAHNRGLQIAEAATDTIEIVRALNNIGTNYRRLGIVDLAADYHYRAWVLTETFHDTIPAVLKSKAMSLNGLGNVYLTMGNEERADSALRMALREEEKLGSIEGRAINMANLGSIFLKRKEYDSAYYYFSQSMELNRKAKNQTGIALCNSYFGKIFEERGDFNQAVLYTKEAYLQMYNSKDIWHATTTAISLASLYRNMNERDSAMKYLNRAESMARKLKSNEHLAEIYKDYYAIYKYKKEGNYKEALRYIEEGQEYYESVVNLKKLNRIQYISINAERQRQHKDMTLANATIERERNVRQRGYFIFGAVLLTAGLLVALLAYIVRMRNQSNRVLKEVSRLREKFFTNITHEFRTPLTLILGLSQELAKDKGIPSPARDKMQNIERQGQHLLALINQLLDISKVESAVGQPNPVNGDVVPQLMMIVEGYRNLANRHEIDLHLFAPKPVVMDYTPDYVFKVMNNLISNALKFTPRYGRVTIDVRASGSWLHLSVSDTGRGISEEDLPHIFEPFFQAGDNIGQSGTGIGLSLVRQIMHSIGGTIRVESKLGEGTTFFLDIPIQHKAKPGVFAPTAPEITPATPLAETSSSEQEESLEEDDARTRILIIEDNRDVATFVAQVLGSSYDISFASDGREGLEKALDQVPDLIITDLMMPHTDGFEVCRKIRSTDIVNHIPIIVLTAKGSDNDRLMALDAGADAYLEKPFNSDELRLRVSKLLEQRRRLRDKYSAAMVEGKEGEIAHSEEDLRFLGKVVDAIHYLMLRKETDVNTVASRMCMSTRQFHRKMLALTGETPAAYILRIKIRKAQQLLDATPNMAFTEVAERSGFEDYSVFTRSFRKVVGVTPTQYVRGAKE